MASVLWAGVVSLGLSGCGAALNPGSVGFFKDVSLDRQALDALGRGDLVKAETYGDEALKANSQDPVAILTLAIVYQHTGRSEGARQYYELLISMHSEEMIPSPNGDRSHTVDEIARRNLADMTGAQEPQQVSSMEQVMAQQAYAEDVAAVRRFQTLRHLLDLDLITRDEYEQRYRANLGALLQYTADKPPAYGITRPAPEAREVVERLRAINANYQEQSISADELTLERNTILEALMPAHPERRADRVPAVADEAQYAAKVARLQHLLDAGLVTKVEADKERRAIEVQIGQVRVRAQSAVPTGSVAPYGAEAAAGDRDLLLGLYGSKKAAERAWQTLSGKYPAELGGLTPHVAKEAAGKKRGRVRYRLTAGPVADEATAKNSCRALKLFDLPCTPVKRK